MEKQNMYKQEFAELLGISLSTLERREKLIGYILPRGYLSPEMREGYNERWHEYQQKKRDECLKNSRDVK